MAQQIPGSTDKYRCFSCQQVGRCEPKWKLFICGCCNSKVCYLFQSSEYIRCRKCSTVNHIPIPPTREVPEKQKAEKTSAEVQEQEEKVEVPFDDGISEIPRKPSLELDY